MRVCESGAEEIIMSMTIIFRSRGSVTSAFAEELSSMNNLNISLLRKRESARRAGRADQKLFESIALTLSALPFPPPKPHKPVSHASSQ